MRRSILGQIVTAVAVRRVQRHRAAASPRRAATAAATGGSRASRTIDVEVPAGVDDGQRLRLAGRGAGRAARRRRRATSTSRSGSRPTRAFERQGDDLAPRAADRVHAGRAGHRARRRDARGPRGAHRAARHAARSRVPAQGRGRARAARPRARRPARARRRRGARPARPTRRPSCCAGSPSCAAKRSRRADEGRVLAAQVRVPVATRAPDATSGPAVAASSRRGARPRTSTSSASTTRVLVDGDDGHHLQRVRRLRAGERVTAADGTGGGARTSSPHARQRRVALDGRRPTSCTSRALVPGLAVAFALTRATKPELVVQKLTELGVDRILLVRAARSVVRWDGDRRRRGRSTRLRRVAREAAMQSPAGAAARSSTARSRSPTLADAPASWSWPTADGVARRPSSPPPAGRRVAGRGRSRGRLRRRRSSPRFRRRAAPGRRRLTSCGPRPPRSPLAAALAGRRRPRDQRVTHRSPTLWSRAWRTQQS